MKKEKISVKYLFNITIVVLIAITAVLLIPRNTEANKSLFGKGSADELETAKQTSLEVLGRRISERSLLTDVSSLRVENVSVDDLKMAHTKVRQTINNVPVWEGEAIVHLKEDGSVFAITDDMKNVLPINTEPNFSEKDAVSYARRMYRGSKFLTEEPNVDLWIYKNDDQTQLVYRVQMRREDGSAHTAMPVIFIDAHSGEKVFQYDNLQTQSSTGSGSSLYSGTVSIGTYKSGNPYYLENTVRRVGTFNSNNTTNSVFRFSDTDNIWNSAVQRAGVDAHWGAEKTMNYYQSVHGRNGINGSGGPTFYNSINGVGLISSKVHYSTNYNNAFWNGSLMTYGDGNGTTFSPLVSVDVVGHEFTHGVTQYTANLTYANQSGALNEAISDIFGAMIERYAKGSSANNWKIGEEIYTPATAGDALRHMDNPHLASNKGYTADDDPDHYSERYTGTGDNGGVHINSGIANKAFYLLSNGGTHHLGGGAMTGIGSDKAARIWYRALTTYMTSGTTFAGARTATINASNAIYGAGSVESTAVANAWTRCGV
jgi:thermolysin